VVLTAEKSAAMPFRYVPCPGAPHLDEIEWDEEVATLVDRRLLPFKAPVAGRNAVPAALIVTAMRLAEKAQPLLDENGQLRARIADLEAEVERLTCQVQQARLLKKA
jgi:hypothetical protein